MTRELIANVLGVRREGGLRPAANQSAAIFSLSRWNRSECCVGDQLQIGSALFAITQPRVPCFKLGMRLGDENLPSLFSQSARTGFYLRVLREGAVEAGDTGGVVERGYGNVAIKRLFEAYLKRGDKDASRTLIRALEVPELSPEWRAHIERRLERGQT